MALSAFLAMQTQKRVWRVFLCSKIRSEYSAGVNGNSICSYIFLSNIVTYFSTKFKLGIPADTDRFCRNVLARLYRYEHDTVAMQTRVCIFTEKFMPCVTALKEYLAGI